jgi:UPF0755 protein
MSFLTRIIVFAGVTLLLLAGYEVYQVFYAPNDFGEETEKVLFVSRGQTFASVVDSLEMKGMIRSRPLFIFVGRFLGGTNRIQVGKYVFTSGVSNMDLYLSLRDGKSVALISVTVPEGLRPRIQARIFSRSIGIDSARYTSLVNDESFARSLGINGKSLEGYLMPETYHFYWQPEERDVIKRLVDEFKEFYNDSLQARAKELGWTTDQVLALASIIEGEAVLPEERTIISGVYHNRLRRGMRLEADPTIQYMLEDGPRRVLYSDLKVDHPYNTYRNKGLPPGPVNNPGRAAILAALYPTSHNFLFFVANGKGGHWFTSNYADHLRYVRMYRKMRRQQELGLLSQASLAQVKGE